MSPARQHRLKVLALQEAALASPSAAPAVTQADAAEADAAVLAKSVAQPAVLSPAARHRARFEAAATVVAANDNDEGPKSASKPKREASPTALKKLELAGDKKALKAIQSQEKKIALKRERLPSYDTWLGGVIDATLAQQAQDPAFRPAQDDILVTMLIWRLDVGDLVEAVRLFDFAQTNGFALPTSFKRNLPTFVAEQAAEFANAEIKADRPVALEALVQLEALSRQSDMPDEVRAQLHKAIGLELVRRGETGEAGPTRRARLGAAIDQLRRARDLDGQCGVGTIIGRLEKILAKPDPAPPTAETVTQVESAEAPALNTPEGQAAAAEAVAETAVALEATLTPATDEPDTDQPPVLVSADAASAEQAPTDNQAESDQSQASQET